MEFATLILNHLASIDTEFKHSFKWLLNLLEYSSIYLNLLAILKTIKKICPHRLITVFWALFP